MQIEGPKREDIPVLGLPRENMLMVQCQLCQHFYGTDFTGVDCPWCTLVNTMKQYKEARSRLDEHRIAIGMVPLSQRAKAMRKAMESIEKSRLKELYEMVGLST